MTQKENSMKSVPHRLVLSLHRNVDPGSLPGPNAKPIAVNKFELVSCSSCPECVRRQTLVMAMLQGCEKEQLSRV